MFDTRKTPYDGGIVDVIKILAANGESGRLDMIAGKIEGAFFFKNGRLADARVGDLRGFQAMNAAASVRDARFTFDPTAVPPYASSITQSERVVLKQFLGIETINPDDAPNTPAQDEVTIETQRLPVPVVPLVPDPVVPDPVAPAVAAPVLNTRFSRSLLYRGGVVLAVLFVLIAVTAVALRNRYRERTQPSSVAVAPPSVETTTTQPAAPVPAVAPAAGGGAPATGGEAPAVAAEVRDLTGRWNVVNTIEKTSFRSFHNLKIGFDLAISQNGKSFTGTGQKVSENGRALPAGERTPIQVKGSIEGDRIEATFFEDGAARKTTGRFVWKIDATGGLNGTFASTAARSSGKSAARKS